MYTYGQPHKILSHFGNKCEIQDVVNNLKLPQSAHRNFIRFGSHKLNGEEPKGNFKKILSFLSERKNFSFFSKHSDLGKTFL